MHKVTLFFPKKHTILPEKLHPGPFSGTLSDCAEPFRRCRRGCQPHRPSLLPDARRSFQPDDAVHRPSQRAASVIAARCVGTCSALHLPPVHPARFFAIASWGKSATPAGSCQEADDAVRDCPGTRSCRPRRFPKRKENAPPSCTYRRRGIITTVVLLIHYH